MKKNQFCHLLLLGLLLAGAQASAQDDREPATDSPATEGPEIPADKLDRGTPLRSAEGFLAAADEADYEAAAEYLELAEELNMRILEIIAQSDTSLSLPARTLHIEQTDGSGKAAIK